MRRGSQPQGRPLTTEVAQPQEVALSATASGKAPVKLLLLFLALPMGSYGRECAMYTVHSVRAPGASKLLVAVVRQTARGIQVAKIRHLARGRAPARFRWSTDKQGKEGQHVDLTRQCKGSDLRE